MERQQQRRPAGLLLSACEQSARLTASPILDRFILFFVEPRPSFKNCVDLTQNVPRQALYSFRIMSPRFTFNRDIIGYWCRTSTLTHSAKLTATVIRQCTQQTSLS